jgi:hypothetical protein
MCGLAVFIELMPTKEGGGEERGRRSKCEGNENVMKVKT